MFTGLIITKCRPGLKTAAPVQRQSRFKIRMAAGLQAQAGHAALFCLRNNMQQQ